MDVPYLEVSGSSYEVGVAVGRAFSARLRAFLAFKRHQACGPGAANAAHVAEAGAVLQDWCRRRAPHLLDEMRGYAAGAGVPFEDLIWLNSGDEARARATLAAGAVDGCTGFALTPDVTGNGVLAGQSKDGPGAQNEHYIVLLMRPTDRPAVLQLVYPGMLALLGLSETGMTIGTNQIYEGTASEGMPIMLVKRLIWELDRVDQAAALLAAEGLATASNFLLCDAHGQATCVEVKGSDFARINLDDGMLIHTNHYLSEALGGNEDDGAIAAHRSHERRARLAELLRQRRGRITPSAVFDCYRDHDGWPHSICAHQTPNDIHRTTAVLVAEPQVKRLHVSTGQPCWNEPTTYQL